MSDQATDAMQQFGGVGPIHDTSSAGLVLLYANEFARLPSVWPLDAHTTTVVGSSPSAGLVLPVHAVSRMHAELSRERGTWVLGIARAPTARSSMAIASGKRASSTGRRSASGTPSSSSSRRKPKPTRLIASMAACSPAAPCQGGQVGGLAGGYQMDRVARQIRLVAREAPNALSPLSVLLLGESGTGKEVVAQAIHAAERAQGAASAPSTARPCPRTWSRASCSATTAARSRAPIATSPA